MQTWCARCAPEETSSDNPYLDSVTDRATISSARLLARVGTHPSRDEVRHRGAPTMAVCATASA